MNVCFLINQLAPGGAPTLLLDLVRRTDDSTIDYTVCFIEGDDTLVPDFEDAGARVVDFGAECKFDPRALARLVRFFQREEFDVLHAHLPYSQTLGRICACLGGIEHVVSTQHDFPERYHPITRALEQATRPLDDATIAVSQAVERSFTGGAHLWPERNGQWTTIYNGVDIAGFSERVRDADGTAVRNRHDIVPSAPVMLSVGRYVPKKNQAGIIEAFARMHDNRPDARLLLVGWGDLHDDLENAARTHGVEDAVTVTGQVETTAPYYAVADAFVSASSSESFGLVLVEALAAGLPVVGPDVPGAREVLKCGGVAVSPADIDALAAAMERAFDGDGSDAERAALDRFSIERAVESHTDLYERVNNSTQRMNITTQFQNLMDQFPYRMEDLRHGIEHPHDIVSEINEKYNHWRAGQPYNPDGIDVFAEDWDNLIILDACRYDEFARCSTLPGETDHRISRGSTSPEFVRGNFGGKRLHDVVYVTANDWYAKTKDNIDAEIHALDFVDRDLFDGRTSHPETVAAAARDAAEEYPDKRLVIHFMQPHWPYLGPTGEKFKQGPFHEVIRETNATHEDVMQAYRENLDIVLGEVEPLLNDFKGKTVVSADHGELLGDCERPIPVKTYRHPEGVYVDSLVKVPWHVYQNGERKGTVAEQPAEDEDDIDIEAVEQHLADLGYRV